MALRDPALQDDEPAPRPTGASLIGRIVAAICAALVPIFLTLSQVSTGGEDAKGWEVYEAIDFVVLIFAILTIVILAASYASGSPAFPALAVGLAFAMFGIVMVFPLEQVTSTDNSNIEIGGILAILASFGAGLAALVAAASDAARARLR